MCGMRLIAQLSKSGSFSEGGAMKERTGNSQEQSASAVRNIPAPKEGNLKNNRMLEATGRRCGGRSFQVK